MTGNESGPLGDLDVDLTNLHREETFSDLKAASVRRLTPVTPDGSDDGSRPVTYVGETTLMTQMGPIPLNFEIEADSLEAAFGKFPDGVRVAVERLNERASEMARQEASRIVVPTGMPPGMAGGQAGLGPGGMPNPGKILLDK